MLKFECKCGNLSKWGNLFEQKRGDWSNVGILLQKWKSINMLQLDWKIRNWSEYWNLRTVSESIKMLKFVKCQVDQNVEIWVKRGDWSKCQNLSGKAMINQNVEFECECGTRSKSWNLSAKCQINQNVEIWVKRGDWSKCPNLSERGNQ